MIFAINLCPLYSGLKIEEKVSKVSKHGFEYIEFWNWHEIQDLEEFSKKLRANNMKVDIFVGHSKSSPILAADKPMFLKELEESIAVAHKIECANLLITTDALIPHIPFTMPPVSPAKKADIPDREKYENLYTSLSEAVSIAEKEEITLHLEPLDPYDHPGYFLLNTQPAVEIIKKIGSQNLKVLYDIYHMQLTEGNVTNTIVKNLNWIRHFHFADVPGRHEPGTGELNVKNILIQLVKSKFNGCFGFEYYPLYDSDQSLIQIRKMLDELE